MRSPSAPLPVPDAPVRIAMWSGPRNLSTALMRSWGSRADTACIDEPLYAFYLDRTGLAHPGRVDVLAAQPTDWRAVADHLTGPVPGGRPLWYQKHMAHHLLPEVGRDWLAGLTHAFLLRDPRAMLASLTRVLGSSVTAESTGLPQQAELFRRTADRLGHAPPVVDAADVLAAPETALRALCAALGVAFDPAMLHWAPGPRPEDGVWAPHWYASVWASTGFEAARQEPTTDLPARLGSVLETCQALYDELHTHRLTV